MFDANLMFSSAQDISADGNSTNILDVGSSSAKGHWVEVAILGAVTGTTPTMVATVQASDSATFASGVRNLASTMTFNASGQRDAVLVQHAERYLRISYDVSGTTPVFNDVTAGIVSGPQRDTTTN